MPNTYGCKIPGTFNKFPGLNRNLGRRNPDFLLIPSGIEEKPGNLLKVLEPYPGHMSHSENKEALYGGSEHSNISGQQIGEQ
jgi:hypothetical protein